MPDRRPATLWCGPVGQLEPVDTVKDFGGYGGRWAADIDRMKMWCPQQEQAMRRVNDEFDVGALRRESGCRQRHDAGELRRMSSTGEDQRLPLRARRRLHYQTPQGPIDGVKIFSPCGQASLPVPSE